MSKLSLSMKGPCDFLCGWGTTDPCKALRSFSFLQEICDWVRDRERKHYAYRGRKGNQSAKVITLNRGYWSILQKTSCLASRLEKKMKNTQLQWLLCKCISKLSLPWAGLTHKNSRFPKVVGEALKYTLLPIFLVLVGTSNPAVICVGYPQAWLTA